MNAPAPLRNPSGAELLDAWERGRALPAAVRTLPLLAAMLPGAGWDDLAHLPVGRRDARLLDARARLFGERLAGAVGCPRCGDDLEVEFAADDIRQPETATPEATVTLGEYVVRIRPASSADLAALHGDLARARLTLLERCIVAAERAGAPVGAGDLPDEVVAAVARGMAEADPQADVEFALTCPACGAAWSAPFDIAAFLWNELEAWAWRTLDAVHVLARAYGWREADILALSPWRRQYYLQAVGA